MNGSGRDPYLDDGMQGFIANFARKNYWKVSSWYDLDDLVQDGFMCFAKCRARYVEMDNPEPTRDDIRIMMARVRTTFERHIIKLAHNKTGGTIAAGVECSFASMGGPDKDFGDEVARIEPAPPGPESVAALLAGAPWEVAELFTILAGDAARAAAFVRDVSGRRETRGQHVSRLDAGGGMIKHRRVRRPWRGPDGRFRRPRWSVRETTNEFYCRLLGLDPRAHDVRKMVRDYLS